MKNRPGTLHKWFSLSRWQRRHGASDLLKNDVAPNYAVLKTQKIEQGTPAMTRGSTKDLRQHHEDLRQEFSGQYELAFEHAFLIVLIRREYKLSDTVSQFEALWEREADWLLEHLNLRWLISASDTFADVSNDPTEKALALATSLLANTVKIYETENVMSGHTDVNYDPAVIQRVQNEAITLFEGMSCFTVGTDDTLRNMVWRLNDIAPKHQTGRIMLEVLRRLNELPTAYGRMRAHHTRAKTQWY